MMRSSDLSIQIADRLGGFFLGGGGRAWAGMDVANASEMIGDGAVLFFYSVGLHEKKK